MLPSMISVSYHLLDPQGLHCASSQRGLPYDGVTKPRVGEWTKGVLLLWIEGIKPKTCHISFFGEKMFGHFNDWFVFMASQDTVGATTQPWTVGLIQTLFLFNDDWIVDEALKKWPTCAPAAVPTGGRHPHDSTPLSAGLPLIPALLLHSLPTPHFARSRLRHTGRRWNATFAATRSQRQVKIQPEQTHSQGFDDWTLSTLLFLHNIFSRSKYSLLLLHL